VSKATVESVDKSSFSSLLCLLNRPLLALSLFYHWIFSWKSAHYRVAVSDFIYADFLLPTISLIRTIIYPCLSAIETTRILYTIFHGHFGFLVALVLSLMCLYNSFLFNPEEGRSKFCSKTRTCLTDSMSLHQPTNSVALVRERTIPTERPSLVGKVSANCCG
jgi:hypothetical protein